jgi:hypothetical protein
MTAQECAEVLALIRAAILEERERTAKAAGMAPDAASACVGTLAVRLALADFARRLRGK